MTIKELRSSLGMTKTAFGEHFGIPLRSIQNWEMGLRTPPEYIPKLIEANIRAAQKIVMLENEIERLKRSGAE